MSGLDEDPIVSVLPIHFSNTLSPNIHVHQFPLLSRPLQVPPSAAQSGKRIRARIKPKSARLEIHVPVDTRPEVWNAERSQELGSARAEDDQEKSMQSRKGKETGDPRLTEVRMRSEHLPSKGVYVLGIVRDGRLHLHPIGQTHQLRPTLTYIDVLNRKAQRRARSGTDSDEDSDDGPPPDPDEPAPAPPVKKEPKAAASGEAREVNVSIKKAEEKGGLSLQGGLSATRREMLHLLRVEDEEPWDDIVYCDGESEEAVEAFDGVFSKSEEIVKCESDLTSFLNTIPGLR